MTVAELIKAGTGDVTATIVSAESIKSGKKDNYTWIRGKYVISDSTATAKLIVWNGHNENLKIGSTYKISGIYTGKPYNGHTNLELGHHGMVTELVPNIPIESEDEFFRRRQTELKNKQKKADSSQHTLDEFSKKQIIENTEFLYKINTLVTETLKQYMDAPNPAMVGQFTKIIYDDIHSQ